MVAEPPHAPVASPTTGAVTSHASRMTDAEALMWNLERDPRLSSTFGTVLVCEGEIDLDRLRARLRSALAGLPRLTSRVAPPPGGLGNPSWQPDDDFELEHHVRAVSLPAPGTLAQLSEFTARLVQEPFDRTRPLWEFVVVSGLAAPGGPSARPAGPRPAPDLRSAPGDSALVMKVHHSIADGNAAVKMAEAYLDLEALPAWPAPPPGDPADAASPGPPSDAQRDAEQAGRPGCGTEHALDGVRGAVGWLVARNVRLGRRLAGEIGMAFADPERIPEALRLAGRGLASASTQLAPPDDAAHSTLWRARSRRQLELIDLPLEAVRRAAKALGGSLNDFFVAGTLDACVRYHERHDCPLEALTFTFIVSTRTDGSTAANAFTPSRATVDAASTDPATYFSRAQQAMAPGRSSARSGALFTSLAGLAGLLPTSAVTRLARSQAAAIDFATSNVRGAPFEVFVAGARVRRVYPVGPVAGTGFNLTLMSYNGQLGLGLHADPAAVHDPALLRDLLEDAYRDLIEAADEVAAARATEAAP